MMRTLGFLTALVLLLLGVGQTRAGMFTYTGSIQHTTLAPGLYDITVAGAQGGNLASISSSGEGAVLSGEISLTKTEVLQIVVGGHGADGGGGGGGGGRWTIGGPR